MGTLLGEREGTAAALDLESIRKMPIDDAIDLAEGLGISLAELIQQ